MRTLFYCACLGLSFVGVIGLASPARAASPADQAAAEVLFDDAQKLAKASDFEHACPKFAESQRLDPTVGTLLSLGDCLEKVGKLASAWGAFKEAEMTARGAGASAQQAEAARRASVLAPQLAKLAIVVPPPARVAGFELRRDGAVVGEGQWGSSMPADAGQHTIEASAPGYKPWTTVVRIDTNGAAATIEVPTLEKLSVETPGFTWRTQHTVGLVVGAAGLVMLGVAAGFTAKAASKNSESLVYCKPADVTNCHPAGIELRNQAFDAAHVATGTAIGGGVALAAGVIVFVTTPKGAPKKLDATIMHPNLEPIVGREFTGVALTGVW